MKTIRPTRRKRGPVITWDPAHDSYYIVASMLPGASSTRPLHVTQSTLLEVEADLAAGQSPVPFGLLAGRYCVCPETRIEYLLIDEASPAVTTLTSDDPTAQLAEELRSLIADANRRRKLVLGWYIGGMDDDLALDHDLIELHRQLFAEPWNVVLVRSQGAEVRQGAFFRYQPVTTQLYAIPFFELVADASRSVEGAELRTAVRWANYRAREPILPLAPAPGTSTTSRPAARHWAKWTVSEWMERLRGGGARVGASPESSKRERAEPLARPATPRTSASPDPAPAIRIESPASPEPRPRAAPAPQPAAKDQSSVEVQTLPQASASATASVDPPESSLPAKPVRVAFPALLPEVSLEDEAQPQPMRQRVLVGSLGVIGVIAASWLVWSLWLR
jgi:hypothetical protein